MKRLAPTLLLVLASLCASRAMAQPELGLRAVGASAAFVNAENLDGTLGFGVFADLGQITPQIKLEPSIEYWSKSEDSFGAKASVRDIAIGARGKYYFEVTSPKIHPYAGAGLGIHLLHAESSVTMPGFGTISADASDTKLGLDFGGGMETALSPKNDFRVEAWYGIVSDVSQFALRVGVSQKLGR